MGIYPRGRAKRAQTPHPTVSPSVGDSNSELNAARKDFIFRNSKLAGGEDHIEIISDFSLITQSTHNFSTHIYARIRDATRFVFCLVQWSGWSSKHGPMMMHLHFVLSETRAWPRNHLGRFFGGHWLQGVLTAYPRCCPWVGHQGLISLRPFS